MKALTGIFAGCLVMLPILAGCSEGKGAETADENLPYYLSADLTPVWLTDDAADADTLHRVGGFAVVDQNREPITDLDLRGSVTVVDFFFVSCPSMCRTLSEGMKRVQDSTLGIEGLQLFSFSVNPEKDTPEVLREYADAYGAVDGRWRLLTGSHETIYSMARHSFFADVDYENGEYLHTETLFLVDGKGHIRGIYNGTQPTDVARLIEDAVELGEAG